MLHISIFFADIRGFAALAEQLPPAEVAVQLNHFYELASCAIFRYDGTLDKLVGDQVMGFFGAPIGRDDHAGRAVATARGILEAVSGLGTMEGWSVGVGITSGEAFVGNVGGGDMTDDTVLGGTVNERTKNMKY
jgi:adenylate cyclase